MIIKSLIVVHRYVGVVLGVIMTIWCFSGFVMMYQGYPATTPDERQAGLETLNLTRCCVLSELNGEAIANAYRVEMLNGAPILRMNGRDERPGLTISQPAPEVGVLPETQVRGVAETLRPATGSTEGRRTWNAAHRSVVGAIGPAFAAPVARSLRRSGPELGLHQWYERRSRAGRQRARTVLELARRIPHWLYPLILRENGPLWTEVVIWSSAIGCFLVVTGMVIGFIRLRGRSGKWWPYKNRPMWMWHHVFGVRRRSYSDLDLQRADDDVAHTGPVESESAISPADLQGRNQTGRCASRPLQ
ncbi:MAG: hypothetical protein IPO30_00985 [Hyphomonadaceae bacterium]|nr:hypothetical protein [Hyphomonadaceae bacterium]